MAAKKQKVTKISSKKTPAKVKANSGSRANSLLQYFRAGESYTSLVLGIIVVIIASLLLLSLFKTRPDTQKGTTSISTIANQPGKTTSSDSQGFTQGNAKIYTIAQGDNLWTIAVKVYGDGYKWVDIAKANNITNPGIINVGNKLNVPNISTTPVAKSTPTQAQSGSTTISPVQMTKPTSDTLTVQKITSTTYTTTRDDNLWSIAVRAYGDGYKWVDIAKANNIIDPNLIFSGNTIKIPR